MLLSDLFSTVSGRLVGVVAIGIIFFLVYFSIDIYLHLTKRHFGKVNIYLVYFTRDDKPKKTDALHFRVIDSQVPLKKIYGNRFLFWRVIITSTRATLDNPVVDFGKYAFVALSPFRGRIAAGNRTAEAKRALGFPFKEKRHQIVVVNDRSDDKRSRILRVLVIKEDDLRKLNDYLENPPKAGENFELFKKVAETFQKKPHTFLFVQIVAA